MTNFFRVTEKCSRIRVNRLLKKYTSSRLSIKKFIPRRRSVRSSKWNEIKYIYFEPIASSTWRTQIVAVVLKVANRWWCGFSKPVHGQHQQLRFYYRTWIAAGWGAKRRRWFLASLTIPISRVAAALERICATSVCYVMRQTNNMWFQFRNEPRQHTKRCTDAPATLVTIETINPRANVHWWRAPIGDCKVNGVLGGDYWGGFIESMRNMARFVLFLMQSFVGMTCDLDFNNKYINKTQ